MNNLIEVKVPDIGDFNDVPIVEVLVKPGDSVNAEDPLIALESEKATLEVPSPSAGLVKEVKVKTGDKVSKGTLILLLEAASAAQSAAPASQPAAAATQAAKPATDKIPPSPPLQKGGGGGILQKGGGGEISQKGSESEIPQKENGKSERSVSTPSVAQYAGSSDFACEMVVLGSGPGGYSAAFRAADLGMNTVLVERYATLGGVCLNVGCIPSKALLHVAAVIDEAAALAAHGISFGKPQLDLDKLRGWKEKVVAKLTSGLTGMAKARKVTVLTGVGHFIDSHHLEVALSDGKSKQVIKFDKAIIAAGSQAVKLPFIPDDPRVVDSTGALELKFVPKRMLVIGGGIIGLEMATVYSTLGTRIDVVEMLDGLMQGADRDLVKVWQKMNEKRFDKVMLKTKTVAVEVTKKGVLVKFASVEAEQRGQPLEPQLYDLVLVSVGRTPNGKVIGAEKAGINISDPGFIDVDKQMRTNVPHIFAIGDIARPPMLAHKAVHEAHVAAEAAAGQKSYFDARVIPSVAYTDPEIAWVGLTEEEAKATGAKISKSVFPWAASGRAIANGRDEGFTKLLFDEEHHRIIGGGIVGAHAGDLISEIALAIEMGADAVDIGKTIHPHPTVSESIGMAAEVFEGICTDLPPVRKI